MNVKGRSTEVLSRQGVGEVAAGDTPPRVVWLRGEYDLSTAAALWETLAQAISLSDTDLMVDLTEVRFMDAASVGVLIRARQFLAPQSRSLMLRSPSPFARRILDLCGLTELLDPVSNDAAPTAGSAGALSTWVAVPATERSDAHAAVRARVGTSAPIDLVGVHAPSSESRTNVRPADAPTASGADREGR